jgi:predicted RNase H-like HicB family nuclease
MTFIYPAVFTPKEDGSYTARFPDLKGCTASGSDLDDCINDAIEAARTWIQVELEEEDWDLPAVSSPEDLALLPGEEVRTIGVKIRLYDGWDE